MAILILFDCPCDDLSTPEVGKRKISTTLPKRKTFCTMLLKEFDYFFSLIMMINLLDFAIRLLFLILL